VVVAFETVAHFREPVQGGGCGTRSLLDHTRFKQRIVAAHAEHQMARISRHSAELRADVLERGAVHRVQGGTPALRKHRAQLPDHVGSVSHIRGVVENRVTEQHDMVHRRCALCGRNQCPGETRRGGPRK